MKKLFPLLFLSLILYWSCEEEVEGCTNENAVKHLHDLHYLR